MLVLFFSVLNAFAADPAVPTQLPSEKKEPAIGSGMAPPHKEAQSPKPTPKPKSETKSVAKPKAATKPANKVVVKPIVKRTEKILRSNLPLPLQTFFGDPPAGFAKHYLQPALALRAAWEKKGKPDAQLQALNALTKGEFADIALAEIARLERARKNYAKSNAAAEKFAREFPDSTHDFELNNLIRDNDCDIALAAAKNKSAGAVPLLQRCLYRIPWKDWDDREAVAEALYKAMRQANDPLLGPFVTELIQALPATAALRQQLQKEIPAVDLAQYENVARFRSNVTTPAGVKAVNPDLDLFDQGMQLVLKENWGDARELFEKLVAEYPLSEHIDRARFWIARSAEAQGKEELAKTQFESLLGQDPIPYYGMQSALHLKRDLSMMVVQGGEPKALKLEGSPLVRQANSLWRLRALLEAGLLEPARAEAKFLFQHKPGGYTFGQYDPEGALLVAYLFQTAGYSQGAFSHTYAALSLDPKLYNTFTLGLIFPTVFPEEFQQASEETGIHPFLLYSVAKQESAFLPNAVSRANALGLLQLLLPTAQEVTPNLTREKLFEPRHNVLAGARYLKKLLNRFGGNIALALAAYNAGPSRAAQWREKMMESDLMRKDFQVEVFIDTIPFTETRKYVSSILRNYAWYKLLHKDGTIQSIQELAFEWQKQPPSPEPAKQNPQSPAAPETSPDPKSSDSFVPTDV